MKSSLYSLFIFLSIITILSACNNKNISSIEQAQLIRLAINNNDIEKLRSFAALPVIIREQEWVTADDGYGFVLGIAKQLIISTNEEFNRYFKTSINSINISGKKIITKDITLTMFADELKGQKQNWNKLKLYLLVRGEGDVEHIVLLGLEPETNKLRAIYIN